MIHELARHWGWVALRGVLAIVFGLIAFFEPQSAFAALVLLFGAYCFVDGVFELVAAIRLRKEITGEFWLGLAGVLSIAFGILLFVVPGSAALALTIWIGAYAFIFGVMLLLLAFRLRKFAEAHRPAGTGTAGTPATATR